jgi:hypothetical protein
MTVVIAHNGEQAESHLEREGEPTAVISDFELLHGENGVGLIQRLRALGCRAPATILTAAPDRALRTLNASTLDEVIPVISKMDNGTTEGTEGAETVLRIELVPKGGATEIRLTHSGFVSEKSRDGHKENWPLALEMLDEALS